MAKIAKKKKKKKKKKVRGWKETKW